MSEEETLLQHRLTQEDFIDVLNACRDLTKNDLQYIEDDRFLMIYLEFRGVIFSPNSIFKMNYTFQSVSLMSTWDEIMEDALRYYTVYIEKYATVIDSALKNCVHRRQEYFYLSKKEVQDILLHLVEELESERKYIDEAAFGFQCGLVFLHDRLCIEMKEMFGDLLVEIKFNDIFNISDEIGKVKLQDILECNNVYALTRMTLLLTLNGSGSSQRFSLYLVDFGLLTTLTTHLSETSYQVLLNEEPLSMVMDEILQIVYNIAYNSDSKTKQQFESTKKALMIYPKVDSNLRELLTLMSLVYTMYEHELCELSDESNVVDTIIKYMQEALGRHDRFCDIKNFSMSLWELADGLSKLTIKKSNISKIVHKEGALSTLVNMLRHENLKENESAVRCIHALAQDYDVRSTLLEIPDLVAAMVERRNTTSLKVKKMIDDALKTLRSFSPEDCIDKIVSGAVAGLNLVAENSSPKQDTGMQGQSLPAVMHQRVDIENQLNNISPNENQRLSQININVFSSHPSNNVARAFQEEEKFTAKGKTEKLRPEDEKTIRRHWTTITEQLDANYVIDELYSRDVFDVHDKQEISSHATPKKRTETMLQKLFHAGSGSAYETFIEVLDKHHNYIVKELRK